jgi:hypothetical protein
MNFASELFFAGLVPLAVAAAAAFALRRIMRSPPVAWASGVGLGYIAGQLALASRRGAARAIHVLVAPREASEWLPHAVLLALGITILAAYAPRRWRQGVFCLAALLAIGVPARLLAGHVAQQWSILEQISHLALLAATLALVWLLLAAARDDELPRLRQVLLVLASLGAAIVTALSGSFTIGRLCGVAAAALVGTALVAPRGLSGAAGVVTLSLGGLVILGVFYATLHPANAALLLLSIVAAAGRLPDVVSVWPDRLRAGLRVTLCLTPLAIALATRLNP